VPKTLLLIGRAPYLDECTPYLKYLMEMYPSIGINTLPLFYNTTYCCFLDPYLLGYAQNMNKDIKMLTTRANAEIMCTHESILFDTFPYNLSSDDLPHHDNCLAYLGFTHDVCISWAIKNNYKNIVFIAAADFCDEGYSHKFGRYGFNRSMNVQNKSIVGIEKMFSKYINLYTVNPNSLLNIPRITIKELLENKLDK
jgi:hypothetical protein